MTKTAEPRDPPGTRPQPALAEAVAVTLGYGFLAYVPLGTLIPRLLPTDTEPWALGPALWALVLLHLPLAIGFTVLWVTRGQPPGRRLVFHALALIPLGALYLSGVLL